MKMIFIDANIFLRFFDSNRKELKKLLDDLLKISGNIFITNQIVAEIERNKLCVFKSSINNYTNKLKVEKVLLPEHFATDLKQFDIIEWNKRREIVRKDNEKLSKEIDNIFTKNLQQIAKSEDSVSKKLAEIYKLAHKETENELNDARKRKEIGNPPGKESDPLGDQITWEQFINKVPLFNEVWIVTKDSDYLTEHKKSCFLNPFLNTELLLKNSALKINCFTDLLDCLVSFGKKNKIEGFLSKKLIDKIRQEEKTFKRISVESSNICSVGYDLKSQTLEIEFLNGSVYQYFDVPQQIFDGLMSAESHGKYFVVNIRSNFKYVKL